MYKLELVLFSVLLILINVSNGANYPYSDSSNKYGWTQDWSLSDEFWNQNTLNSNKWYDYNPTWLGRQPGLFDPNNVEVKNGKLYMYAKIDWATAAKQSSKGYQKYTTSAVTAKKAIKYGYIEIKAKVGGSKVSSAFWLSNNQKWKTGTWTEIDVFEQAGTVNAKWNDYHILHSNTHIFALAGTSNNNLASKCGCSGTSDCKDPGYWSTNSIRSFSDDYHIYGLWWTSSFIKIYVDGQLIRTITNKCLHQELYLKFDRETFPNWFGLPNDGDLPDDPFIIEYVRTWKQGSAFTEEEAASESGLSGAETAIVVIAALIICGCICIGGYCVHRRKKKMADEVKLEKDEIEMNETNDTKDGYDMSPLDTNNGDTPTPHVIDGNDGSQEDGSIEDEAEIEIDVELDQQQTNQ